MSLALATALAGAEFCCGLGPTSVGFVSTLILLVVECCKGQNVKEQERSTHRDCHAELSGVISLVSITTAESSPRSLPLRWSVVCLVLAGGTPGWRVVDGHVLPSLLVYGKGVVILRRYLSRGRDVLKEFIDVMKMRYQL